MITSITSSRVRALSSEHGGSKTAIGTIVAMTNPRRAKATVGPVVVMTTAVCAGNTSTGITFVANTAVLTSARMANCVAKSLLNGLWLSSEMIDALITSSQRTALLFEVCHTDSGQR